MTTEFLTLGREYSLADDGTEDLELCLPVVLKAIDETEKQEGGEATSTERLAEVTGIGEEELGVLLAYAATGGYATHLPIGRVWTLEDAGRRLLNDPDEDLR